MALFGGSLRNAHGQFLDSPIMAQGHDGRIQKLTMRTPPNNENDRAMKSAQVMNKNLP